MYMYVCKIEHKLIIIMKSTEVQTLAASTIVDIIHYV